MFDEQNFPDQPVKIYLKAYDNIWKIATCQGHDYTVRCLLNYTYFKEHHKL